MTQKTTSTTATACQKSGLMQRNTERRDRIAVELYGKAYGQLQDVEQDHVFHLLESGYDPLLIAAAPDLLAALESALESVLSHNAAQTALGDCIIDFPFDSVRSVIAKAKGGK